MRTHNHWKAVVARALIAALALLSCALGAPALAEMDGMLRVKLARLGSPGELVMRADCDYVLEGEPSVRVPAGAQMSVRASGGSLTLSVGDRSMKLGAGARLNREGGGTAGVAFLSPALSNRFCGDLLLSASDSVVTTVLSIYVEDYLCGVVGYEMAPSSGLEALKAFAVVARNYALMQKAARTASAYDLSDSGDALSFRGYSASDEYADVLRAVDATRGQALYYEGSPATCYFCESNGGQIESSANALGVLLPYSEVRDDPYDFDGAGAKKTASLRKDASELSAELTEALLEGMAEPLKAQGIVTDFEIEAIEAVAPEDSRFDEPSRLYRALAFRLAVTGRTVQGAPRSTEVTVRVPTYGGFERWYDLGINPDDNETVWVSEGERAFEVTFRRSGTGVGLSRRGAQVMARDGLSCAAILEYYYPGCALTQLELADDSSQAEAASDIRPAKPIATARLSQKSRLYDRPDASVGALTTLPAGATVEVYAVQGEWAAIGSGSLYGFTHAEALASFELVGVTVAQVKNDTLAQVNAGPVNVLQLPVATAAALETLAGGSAVRLDAYTDDWALVTTPSGTEGFIPRDALKLQAADRAEEEGDTVTAPDDLFGLLVEDAGLYVNADDTVEPRQTLREGDYVQILAYNSAWSYVRSEGGLTGYVKLNALSAVQRAQTEDDPGDGEIVVVKGEAYRYIAVEALSLFESYSTDSPVLATLRLGDRVRLGAYNAKWACVRVDGVTGFVLLSGLSEENPNATAGTPEGGEVVKVKGERYVAVAADGAPLYPGWDAGEAPLALLQKGTRVQLGAYNAAWACVRADGVTGFMRLEALDLSGAEQDNRVTYRQFDATIVSDAGMYASSDLSGEALTVLIQGERVRVSAYDGRSAYVNFDDQSGFVALEKLDAFQ